MNRAFTTREKVLLVILAVLLIGIGYFKLILEPINSSIETYQSNTAAEQDEILLNTVTLTQMKMMQTELDEIHASGDAKPLPSYDNSDKLLVELNQILDKSDDYSLNFSGTSVLDGGYIVRRPLSLTFTTKTYDEARTILTELHDSDNINQISDLSISFTDNNDTSRVEVSLSIAYYELEG